MEGLTGLTQPDIAAFFYRLFEHPEQRRILLKNWHSLSVNKKFDRLSDVFDHFITTIMYSPATFCLLSDRIHIFGETFPIRFEWLTQEDRALLLVMFKERDKLFKTHKSYVNDHVDLSDLIHFDAKTMLSTFVRRQIVRDFIWMVIQKGDPFAIVEVIVALQQILLNHKSDVFLSTLHQAIQGKCNLFEVPCWDLMHWDLAK